MSIENIKILVPGGLNTDIIGLGVPEIIAKGQLAYGGEMKIGPGGKSRNIAQMISTIVDLGEVAMIGKTSKDPYGLWKSPIDALIRANVNIDYVKIMDFDECGKYPGIALIAVDKNGNNQIYVLPGINEDFSPKDLDESEILFEKASNNNGILALSFELPKETAIQSIKFANKYGLKVIIDPGGIIKSENYDGILNKKIFLIKPNEHETKILTGINVVDFDTAKLGARKFLDLGIENVLITHGEKGAYFINHNIEKYIPLPIVESNDSKDETGCGDQTMATLCAYLSKGLDVQMSVKYAILSGTLQFHRSGIQPITKAEINKYIEN